MDIKEQLFKLALKRHAEGKDITYMDSFRWLDKRGYFATKGERVRALQKAEQSDAARDDVLRDSLDKE
jgi:hypothetical protein